MAKGFSFNALVKALKAPAFADFGKVAGTVVEGNDSRFGGRLLTTPKIYIGSATSGIFVPDPLATTLRVIMCAGGGSGAYATAVNPQDFSCGAGGGAGAYIEMWVDLRVYTGSLAFVVGDGGKGGTAGAAATKTTFAGQTCNPGGPGSVVNPGGGNNIQGGGGSGGSAITVDTPGITFVVVSDGEDGNPAFATRLGNLIGGKGGNSIFGSGGHQAAGSTTAGKSARAQGAGGGGAITSNGNPPGGAAIGGQPGGSGGHGRIDFYQYS